MPNSPLSLLLLVSDGAFDEGSDLGWSLVVLVLAVIIIGPLFGLLYFVTGPRRERQPIAPNSPRPDTAEPGRTNRDNGTRVLVLLVLLSLVCLCMGLFS
jgi:hypothetical protein